MITVHLGRVTAPEDGGIVVHQPDDYAAARQAIREALRLPPTDLHVFVLSRICDEWFWDLESLPGLATLRLEDPATLLRERLRLPALPPELNDSDLIAHLDLLALPAPVRVGDAIGWALGGRLSPAWAEEQPSYDHLGRLVTWFAGQEEIDPLLAPLQERRWERWLGLTNGSLQDAYAELRQGAVRMAIFLCCWTVLEPYSVRLRRRWLEEEGWYRTEWQKVAEKLTGLPLPASAEKVISPKVEAYWNGQFAELDHQERS